MTPFQGNTAATVNIDVSSSSQRVAIPNNNSSVRVVNNGTATVWIAFGDVTVTASLTTSMPIGPGVIEVLRLSNAGYVAAIAAGSTGKIYFTPGEGI